MIKNGHNFIKISTLTWFCLCSLLISFFSYLYFLNLAVIAVAERADLSKESDRIKSEIAILETKYIESRYMITSRIVDIQNNDNVSEKIFVFRNRNDSLAMYK